MKSTELKRALAAAAEAARQAGGLMAKNLYAHKHINEEQQHDIKLELDVRCQKTIESSLRKAFPDVALFGEEGVSGDPQAAARWVVDPIDGTVNFSYGVPHACVSIALQARGAEPKARSRNGAAPPADPYETILGVVYDPFCDELWSGLRGQTACLNGRAIQVSKRARLREAVISMGFSKYRENIERMLPMFTYLLHRVRKLRITGSAALDIVYVASGRFDAFVERGVRLWDIAAGGLILECAGGEFWHRAVNSDHTYELLANNGLLRRQIQAGQRAEAARK